MSSTPTASSLPVGAEWISPIELRIQWGDDHFSIYRTDFLRAQCPCATCRVERRRDVKERDLLASQPTAAGLANPQVEQVGRYAIRLTWRDGHDTGIYPFDYLRGICPCAECAQKGTQGRRPFRWPSR